MSYSKKRTDEIRKRALFEKPVFEKSTEIKPVTVLNSKGEVIKVIEPTKKDKNG